MQTVDEFILWERASRDSIDVKRCYIDLAGDLVAGVLLSQIIFWFLPSDKGSKLRVEHEGIMWLAKHRADWWDECRITPKQFDRAIKMLAGRGLVRHKRFRFGGSPTVHVWLNWPAVVEGVSCILTYGEDTISPSGNLQLDETDTSLTETTTETTTENTPISKDRYGEFNNVLLSDDEMQKLFDRFGATLIDKIEALSQGIESKGYKYKSHYATILNWARKDGNVPVAFHGDKADNRSNDPGKYTGGKYGHTVISTMGELEDRRALKKELNA